MKEGVMVKEEIKWAKSAEELEKIANEFEQTGEFVLRPVRHSIIR